MIRDKGLGPAKNEVLSLRGKPLSHSYVNEGHEESFFFKVLILHVISIHVYKYLLIIQIIYKRGVKEILTILDISSFLVYKVINILSVINYITL